MDNPPEPGPQTTTDTAVEALHRRVAELEAAAELRWADIAHLDTKLADTLDRAEASEARERVLREVLARVRSNVQTVRETAMDPVLGPTYIIYGITLNRIDAALSAYKEGE
jgi:chromosome segregation ATPase